MLTVSNLEALIAPGALAVSGTVSSRLTGMLEPRPCGAYAPCPTRDELPRFSAAVVAKRIEVHPVELGNACASYAELSIEVDGTSPVRARLVELAGAARAGDLVPLVLMFNDAGRPVRGWHHMSRFVAAGCAVLALDAEVVAPENASRGLADLASRALALAGSAPLLEGVDRSRVYAWGEGLGGALALLVTAHAEMGVRRCAVCNPFPLDVEVPAMGCSLLGAAHDITADVLIGTGLRDELAPSEDCARLAHMSAGSTELVVYPEHGHERINQFEDRVLTFFVQDARERS